MCSNYRLVERVPVEDLFEGLIAPEGIPNFEPRSDIRITDRAPIVRLSAAGAPELVQRRCRGRGRAASRCITSAPKAASFAAGAA
jgi:putative SOS response-associated peptidase YedK